MFENASRQRFRFTSPIGELTVEDLWDIPLSTRSATRANLDDIARGLHRQLRNDEDVSFVNPENKSDSTIQAKFDLVKHVIDVRLAEQEAARTRQENREKAQRILAIIADREDEELKSKSLDELRELAKSMAAS